MRAKVSAIFCDGDDGGCGTWTSDYYEECADTVGGVKITKDKPAPGWTVIGHSDYCPEHGLEVPE